MWSTGSTRCWAASIRIARFSLIRSWPANSSNRRGRTVDSSASSSSATTALAIRSMVMPAILGVAQTAEIIERVHVGRVPGYGHRGHHLGMVADHAAQTRVRQERGGEVEMSALDEDGRSQDAGRLCRDQRQSPRAPSRAAIVDAGTLGWSPSRMIAASTVSPRASRPRRSERASPRSGNGLRTQRKAGESRPAGRDSHTGTTAAVGLRPATSAASSACSSRVRPWRRTSCFGLP